MQKVFFYGWLAGISLTIITGPIGSFIIWRKMSSFGDTLSHSSLLGISCAIFFNINPFWMVITTVLSFSIFIIWLEKNTILSLDSILGIISYSLLSLGIIMMNFISGSQKKKLTHYLFGNLLEITYIDLIIIFICCFSILIILIWYWNLILLVTINSDLAKIDGINISKVNFILVLLIAVTVGISIKFIGSLIVISLLTIPSATAQRFSNSPEKMAILSVLIGMVSITGGMLLSICYNIPIGPSIVLFSTSIFLISMFKKNT